ncbi:tetratricopeptide repeat-containing sensor histidine kinase [Ekhidna sp.]|uniref:tetratricopeptide repeat-containing sensor histidine kinase n=1 Tax=Ekhidna sp. TaxID=2608089 RepID=UPI003BA9099A
MIRVSLVTILFASLNFLCAQNQSRVDSLKSIIKETDIDDEIRIDALHSIIQLSSDPNEVIKYSDSLLYFRDLRNSRIIDAYTAKGVAYRMQGELKTALLNLFKSAELANENDLDDLAAEAYLEIGITYRQNSDFTNALVYQNKAIDIFRKLNKKQELAINLLNTGYAYYSMQLYDTALLYYNEAAPLFDTVGLTIGKAYSIGNRALVLWKTGKIEKAEKDLLTAIDMLKPLGDQFGMADYHNQLGNLYLEQGRIPQAIDHLNRGLRMAKEMDLKEQIRDASLLLSRLYSSNDEYEKALQNHQQYVAYKDSIENSEQTKKMADLRTDFEVNLREKEIDSLEKEKQLQQTYIIIAITLLLLALIILLYFRQRFKNTKLLAAADRTKHDVRVKDLLKSQETKALQAMVQGKEDERKHLAKEIHNHLGSLLATVKVNLNGMEIQDPIKQQKIVNLVDRACQDVRNISHELNMGVSENFGLVPALKELVDHLKQSNELKIELTTSINKVHIESQNEILVYRIVQELVSNVLKHANATKLSISLTGFEDEGIVNILVQDNGKGFNSKALIKDSKGIGLDSLEEMVEKMDGEMSIDSDMRSGTTVSIDLPVIKTELSIEEP